MKSLLNIRISVIGCILFVFFLLVISTMKQQHITPGQLALFSVNSFLFGYYFSPLLNTQKLRVAALNAAARQEEMTILDILTQSHLLAPATRHALKVKLRVYLASVIHNQSITADNPYYDELLYYSKTVKGEDVQVMNLIYDRISKTQANRDTMNNLFSARVYSHEWLVGAVLYTITLYFALQTDYNHALFFGLVLAVLCTGLSLLMVILIKYATLTHKEARRMWDPLDTLLTRHFDDVTPEEIDHEKQAADSRIQARRSPSPPRPA